MLGLLVSHAHTSNDLGNYKTEREANSEIPNKDHAIRPEGRRISNVHHGKHLPTVIERIQARLLEPDAFSGQPHRIVRVLAILFRIYTGTKK